MNDRQSLARLALRSALTLRRSKQIAPNQPVQIYDLVEALGIELRFLNVPSMEGMYYKAKPPAIIVSSLRPRGRRAFTCAHELGHHVFGHGTRADELLAQPGANTKFNSEEYLADTFASSLLMPKAAVDWAFRCRGWLPSDCAPLQAYTVACWLGVGYETLLNHMARSLNMLTRARMEALLRNAVRQIRSDVLGFEYESDLLIADERWEERAVDIETNDLIALPSGVAIEGTSIELFQADGDRTLVRGVKPGLGRVLMNDLNWFAYVRVSRHGFVGRSIFRHLEDESDE